MPNHLAGESSPYLLQHADNPVDWYPWGEEALTRARLEDRPILLSIGYAACHWCHVMAHESFEDDETAELMNRYFINIKVDREERPDLDSIYMSAVVAMTGQGGWPMTVVLTPEGQPFFGGTYYPKYPRYGMPSFKQVLLSLAAAWKERRDEIAQSAAGITAHLNRRFAMEGQDGVLGPGLLDRAVGALNRSFDERKGGFGNAPKFPPAMAIEFLLRLYVMQGDARALHMAEFTLEQMAHGGMYDQLGGGFARYSTDDDWLVPHFEKMLYDNALLSRVYLHAWQLTGRPLYRRIAEETLDWVAREMRHEAGGFYSSLDADSEGEEGKFYVWSAAEVRGLLADEAGLFMNYYSITAQGNWEGHNILHIRRTLDEVAAEFGLSSTEAEQRLGEARERLYAARAERVWPGLDDKVLTAWNGLMLAAFAEAGRALKRSDYLQIAAENADFLHRTMRRPDGRLLRTWKAGASARYNGYLEDYAFLADGLLALYQSTFEERWFLWAIELVETIQQRFADEAGGFFDTSDDHETLLHRPKDVQDNAVPSGNAMVAGVLLQLSLLTGNGDYWQAAEKAVSTLYGAMAEYPNGFAQWLQAATLIIGEPVEIAIAGTPGEPDTAMLLEVTRAGYRPFQAVAVGRADSEVPLLRDRPQRAGRATAYVCRRFVCHEPVTEVDELRMQLTARQ